MGSFILLSLTAFLKSPKSTKSPNQSIGALVLVVSDCRSKGKDLKNVLFPLLFLPTIIFIFLKINTFSSFNLLIFETPKLNPFISDITLINGNKIFYNISMNYPYPNSVFNVKNDFLGISL